jgi:hypothetical protein
MLSGYMERGFKNFEETFKKSILLDILDLLGRFLS